MLRSTLLPPMKVMRYPLGRVFHPVVVVVLSSGATVGLNNLVELRSFEFVHMSPSIRANSSRFEAIE